MKQLSLFAFSAPKTNGTQELVPEFSYWKLFVDGASRNNPGPAGAGIVLYKDTDFVHEHGVYLGKKTNNEAEYLALLLGILEFIKRKEPNDIVLIISDSQLLVRQLQGQYKVKVPHLQVLQRIAQQMLAPLSYDVHHVLREENVQADAQANKGIDTQQPPSAEFLALLQQHGLSL